MRKDYIIKRNNTIKTILIELDIIISQKMLQESKKNFFFFSSLKFHLNQV